MADQLQLRGGTTTEHSTFTGALREVTVDTTKKTIVVHDNATAGGTPLAKENLSNVPAGTITSTMIADGTIATADIADGAVTSGKIADGTIVNADINAAAAIDLTKLANGALPTGITVSSANITDLTLATADIADGAVTSAKIADGTIVNADINAAAAIDKTKISGTAITAGDTGTVTSTMIADGTILNADINASAAIAGTKISPDFGSQNTTTTGTSTAASFIPTSSTAPSNGVYLPSANNVAISTNGTGRLFVDASGNVGVGATPSSYKLDVFGAARLNSSLDASLYLEEPSANSVRIKAGTSASFIGTTSNHPFYFVTNNTERMRLTSAGLLGLGTSSPGYRLTVVDNSSGVQGRFESSSTSGTTLGFLNTATNGRNYRIGSNYVTGNGEFAIYDDTAAASRLFINSSGSVGIGTTTVTDKLTLAHSDATGITFKATGTDGATSAKITFEDTAGGTGGVLTFDHNDNSFKIATAGTTERARIDSSGRLLVGTSSNNSSFSSAIQIAGSSNAGTQLISRFDNNTDGAWLYFAKSRSASVGTNTVVQSGDKLGSIGFYGADGTSYVTSATIAAEVDGTPGTNDMPGRLVFSTTADGASSPTERMRISNNGSVGIGVTDPAAGASATSGVAFRPGSHDVWFNHANGVSSGTVYAYFTYNSGSIGSIYKTEPLPLLTTPPLTIA
jgi:hypothetical protein